MVASHIRDTSNHYTHRDVSLNLLIGQRDSGAAVGWRWCQAEAVVGGVFCSCQRLLEVLDETLSWHLQFLSLPTHCRFTDYKNKQGGNAIRMILQQTEQNYERKKGMNKNLKSKWAATYSCLAFKMMNITVKLKSTCNLP